MKRGQEILESKFGDLTDEEICKGLRFRMKSRVSMIAYVGDDKHVYFFWSWKDKIGKLYYSRLITPIHKLWDKVSTGFDFKFGFRSDESVNENIYFDK